MSCEKALKWNHFLNAIFERSHVDFEGLSWSHRMGSPK